MNGVLDYFLHPSSREGTLVVEVVQVKPDCGRVVLEEFLVSVLGHLRFECHGTVRGYALWLAPLHETSLRCSPA